MKTNTLKTGKSQQFNGIIILVHLIITIAFIAIVVKFAQPEFGTATMKQNVMSNELADIESRLAVITQQANNVKERTRLAEMTYFKPLSPILAGEVEVHALETGKLIQMNRDRKLSIVADETTLSSANVTAGATPDMTTLREYLIPASDPELSFEYISTENSKEAEFAYSKNAYLESMRDSKMEEVDALLHRNYYEESNLAENPSGTSADFSPDMALIMEFLAPISEEELEIVPAIDPKPVIGINAGFTTEVPKMAYTKNTYLENMRDMKMQQLDEFYAFQQIIKECLVAEREAPLTLEEWMTSDRCWCTDRNKNVALHEKVENK